MAERGERGGDHETSVFDILDSIADEAVAQPEIAPPPPLPSSDAASCSNNLEDGESEEEADESQEDDESDDDLSDGDKEFLEELKQLRSSGKTLEEADDVKEVPRSTHEILVREREKTTPTPNRESPL